MPLYYNGFLTIATLNGANVSPRDYWLASCREYLAPTEDKETKTHINADETTLIIQYLKSIEKNDTKDFFSILCEYLGSTKLDVNGELFARLKYFINAYPEFLTKLPEAIQNQLNILSITPPSLSESFIQETVDKSNTLGSIFSSYQEEENRKKEQYAKIGLEFLYRCYQMPGVDRNFLIKLVKEYDLIGKMSLLVGNRKIIKLQDEIMACEPLISSTFPACILDSVKAHLEIFYLVSPSSEKIEHFLNVMLEPQAKKLVDYIFNYFSNDKIKDPNKYQNIDSHPIDYFNAIVSHADLMQKKIMCQIILDKANKSTQMQKIVFITRLIQSTQKDDLKKLIDPKAADKFFKLFQFSSLPHYTSDSEDDYFRRISASNAIKATELDLNVVIQLANMGTNPKNSLQKLAMDLSSRNLPANMINFSSLKFFPVEVLRHMIIYFLKLRHLKLEFTDYNATLDFICSTGKAMSKKDFAPISKILSLKFDSDIIFSLLEKLHMEDLNRIMKEIPNNYIIGSFPFNNPELNICNKIFDKYFSIKHTKYIDMVLQDCIDAFINRQKSRRAYLELLRTSAAYIPAGESINELYSILINLYSAIDVNAGDLRDLSSFTHESLGHIIPKINKSLILDSTSIFLELYPRGKIDQYRLRGLLLLLAEKINPSFRGDFCDLLIKNLTPYNAKEISSLITEIMALIPNYKKVFQATPINTYLELKSEEKTELSEMKDLSLNYDPNDISTFVSRHNFILYKAKIISSIALTLSNNDINKLIDTLIQKAYSENAPLAEMTLTQIIAKPNTTNSAKLVELLITKLRSEINHSLLSQLPNKIYLYLTTLSQLTSSLSDPQKTLLKKEVLWPKIRDFNIDTYLKTSQYQFLDSQNFNLLIEIKMCISILANIDNNSSIALELLGSLTTHLLEKMVDYDGNNERNLLASIGDTLNSISFISNITGYISEETLFKLTKAVFETNSARRQNLTVDNLLIISIKSHQVKDINSFANLFQRSHHFAHYENYIKFESVLNLSIEDNINRLVIILQTFLRACFKNSHNTNELVSRLNDLKPIFSKLDITNLQYFVKKVIGCICENDDASCFVNFANTVSRLGLISSTLFTDGLIQFIYNKIMLDVNLVSLDLDLYKHSLKTYFQSLNDNERAYTIYGRFAELLQRPVINDSHIEGYFKLANIANDLCEIHQQEISLRNRVATEITPHLSQNKALSNIVMSYLDTQSIFSSRDAEKKEEKPTHTNRAKHGHSK